MKQMPYDEGYRKDNTLTMTTIMDLAWNIFPDDARAPDWMLEWADRELDLTKYTPQEAAMEAMRAYREAHR